jgi:2,4-dienoyl-CoA reductase-like NADH-dependent reductase (Old Yellow Enzyme family)/thioredoxin reductase
VIEPTVAITDPGASVYPQLFSPGRIGSVELRNRIVMAPMGTELAGLDGSVSERMIDYYEARARGGAALVTVEYSDVDPVGVASIRRYPPGIDRDEHVAGWERLARAIHRHGARAAVQIGHAGRQTQTEKLADWAARAQPVAPSPVPCRHIVHEVPRELTVDEVEECVRSFVQAAGRVAEAGFDAVNVHAAHGYLVNAFLSPYSNHRRDQYGGGLEGRTRFLREIVEGIRAEQGDRLAIIVRLSVDEFVPAGLVPEDVREIAQRAAEAGAHAIDVTASIYDSEEPVQVSPWGWAKAPLADGARLLRDAVDIPIMVANRIHQPDVAEQVLADGSADFVCLGRPLLADPDLPNKVLLGRESEVRWCISCNECVSSELRGDRDSVPDHSVFCAVNPAAGREREHRLRRATSTRSVVVVGAGFAGLEAATTLARRGHAVELWEQQDVVGGQALLAAAIPHKADEIRRLLRFYENELRVTGVQLRLGRRADARGLAESGTEVLVAATGERQRQRLQGAGGKAVHFDDVLRERVAVGRRVLIVGGGFAGADTATYLAQSGRGHTVTLATRVNRVLPKMAPINRHVAVKELARLGVRILAAMTEFRLEEGVAKIADARGERTSVEVDDVIDAGGMRPELELHDAVRELAPETPVYTVGGCAGAGTFLQAIHGGERIGRLVD